MLKHLIKYDLKFIYKQPIVFYIIVLTLAILARLTMGVNEMVDPPFLLKFFHEFCKGATFGFSLGLFINSTMRVWARYKYTMYGDESYLTHTLPLSRSTIWLSKFLSAAITTFFNILVLLVALLIVLYSPEIIEIWNANTNSSIWLSIAIILLALFCQVMFITTSGLVGITLGYRHSHNPMAFAILYGFIIYLVGGILMLAACFLWGKIDTRFYELMLEGHIYNEIDVNTLFMTISGFYIALIAATYFINGKLLKRGINVD